MQVTRNAAYGLLVDSNRLLLCRLSARVPIHAGKWTLPGGGLDFGEHPEQAVVREFREETGLHVTVNQIAGVRSLTVDEPDRQFHSIQMIYHVRRMSGELSFEADGTTDRCEWFAVDEIPELPIVGLVEHSLGLIGT